jgi:hypothetical protein
MSSQKLFTTQKLRNARFVKIFLFTISINLSNFGFIIRGAESLRFSITDETIDVKKLLENYL